MRDSSVGTVTWHSAGRPMNRRSIAGRVKKFIRIRKRPDRLLESHSLSFHIQR